MLITIGIKALCAWLMEACPVKCVSLFYWDSWYSKKYPLLLSSMFYVQRWDPSISHRFVRNDNNLCLFDEPTIDGEEKSQSLFGTMLTNFLDWQNCHPRSPKYNRIEL